MRLEVVVARERFVGSTGMNERSSEEFYKRLFNDNCECGDDGLTS